MRNTKILALAVEIVGFLFAAFGGFLIGIAPPEEADARFAVGLSSFLSLAILLIVAGVAQTWSRRRLRKIWLVAAGVFFVLTVVLAFTYWKLRDRLTFAFPPGTLTEIYVAGTELTPAARDHLASQATELSSSELLDRFGGLVNREKVWVAESISRARFLLIASYVALVVSLAGGIFSLTEGQLNVPLEQPPVNSAKPREQAAQPIPKKNKQPTPNKNKATPPRQEQRRGKRVRSSGGPSAAQ